VNSENGPESLDLGKRCRETPAFARMLVAVLVQRRLVGYRGWRLVGYRAWTATEAIQLPHQHSNAPTYVIMTHEQRFGVVWLKLHLESDTLSRCCRKSFATLESLGAKKKLKSAVIISSVCPCSCITCNCLALSMSVGRVRVGCMYSCVLVSAYCVCVCVCVWFGESIGTC
jgi:hypothetical protein